MPKPAQIDPDVYRDYLQGQVYFDQRLTERQTPASRDALDRAVALFQKVVAAAPDFADGQAALAAALLSVNSGGRYDAQIRQALARALALDPENPSALTATIETAQGAQDWDAVIRSATILGRTGQHTAVGAQGLASAYEAFDFSEAALAENREWARLDPFSNPAWQGVARDNFVLARFADAVTASDEALALASGRSRHAAIQMRLARLSEADRRSPRRAGRPVGARHTGAARDPLQVLHPPQQRRREAVHRLRRRSAERGPHEDRRSGRSRLHAQPCGADDRAMDSYEKALRDGDFIFGFYPGRSAPPAFLQTPRWIALTQSPVFRTWSDARETARRAWAFPAP